MKIHKEINEKLVDEKLLIDRDAYNRIIYTADISRSKGSKFVFETITEDLNAKRRLFINLERYLSKDTVFTTNTSSYMIGEIARPMKYPHRLIGMHFSNPPINMDLIEIVLGEKTSDYAVDVVLEKSTELGKKAIILDRDCRGFVLNRILYAAFIDTLLRLEEGEKPEDIDAGIKNLGIPYGPVEGMDLIGIDTVARIFNNLFEGYGERFQYPRYILHERIKKGLLGKKSGYGFYKWIGGVAIIPEGEIGDPIRTVAAAINEAYRVERDGVADRDKIDNIYKLGVNAPAGLFETGEILGIEEILKTLKELYKLTGHKIYQPSTLSPL